MAFFADGTRTTNVHFTIQNLRPKHFNKLIMSACLLWKSKQLRCNDPEWRQDEEKLRCEECDCINYRPEN